MDSTSPADQPAPSRAELAIPELRVERADTLRAFVGLSEATRRSGSIGGVPPRA